MINGVQIVDLRDAPTFRDKCVQQNLEQWGTYTGIGPEGMNALFKADNAPGSLPVTLIALVDGNYSGCVSLRQETMGALTHPEIYIDGVAPWLSNMWVADDARGHGVASALTATLEKVAHDLGFRSIYSSTAHPDSLYHKFGYVDLEERRYRSDSIYLIRKELC